MNYLNCDNSETDGSKISSNTKNYRIKNIASQQKADYEDFDINNEDDNLINLENPAGQNPNQKLGLKKNNEKSQSFKSEFTDFQAAYKH